MPSPTPMWREVAGFELALQRREFLTWIYVAIFFLLCFGYASSGAVELVNGRGATWKNAPWSIAHAMAGVTAFGQVITTMITATSVMRDVATRTQELLFTTRLTRGAYLCGRYTGALATMLLVYLAIPTGLLAGFAMPWVDRSTIATFAAGSYARPLLFLVVPNVLVVSTLFFAAGALRRGFMAILLLGLSLVACWQTGLSLVHGGESVAGALIDPFGNAALEAMTASWDTTMRNSIPIPFDGVLLGNRILWMTIGAAAGVVLVRRFRFEIVPQPARASIDQRAPVEWATTRALRSPAARGVPGWWEATLAEGRWIFRWTLRERGFVTLATIGALNAVANAWGASASSPTAASILAAVQGHARVLLILLATIYAGELVWRDRDVRSHELRDALPVSTGAVVSGRLAGILLAELVVVAPLAVCALLVGGMRGGGAAVDVGLTITWIFGLVFPFLAELTLLSFAIHVLVQDKVAGHVLLIVGWVLAVAVERTTMLPPWVRFAEPPPFAYTATDGFGDATSSIVWSEGYYLALSVIFALVATLFWARGIPMGWRDRLRVARERLTWSMALALCAAGLAAATAAARLTVVR